MFSLPPKEQKGATGIGRVERHLPGVHCFRRGHIEFMVAKSVSIRVALVSSDNKLNCFKLRSSLWDEDIVYIHMHIVDIRF